MTENLSPSTLDGLLAETRRVFECVRSGRDGDAEPLSGEGMALDGQVRAVAVAPGRIETLELDPRVMRGGSEAVCEAVVEAVNAALYDLRMKAVAETGSFDARRVQEDMQRLQ
jgi:hypothetical protein